MYIGGSHLNWQVTTVAQIFHPLRAVISTVTLGGPLYRQGGTMKSTAHNGANFFGHLAN